MEGFIGCHWGGGGGNLQPSTYFSDVSIQRLENECGTQKCDCNIWEHCVTKMNPLFKCIKWTSTFHIRQFHIAICFLIMIIYVQLLHG